MEIEKKIRYEGVPRTEKGEEKEKKPLVCELILNEKINYLQNEIKKIKEEEKREIDKIDKIINKIGKGKDDEVIKEIITKGKQIIGESSLVKSVKEKFPVVEKIQKKTKEIAGPVLEKKKQLEEDWKKKTMQKMSEEKQKIEEKTKNKIEEIEKKTEEYNLYLKGIPLMLSLTKDHIDKVGLTELYLAYKILFECYWLVRKKRTNLEIKKEALPLILPFSLEEYQKQLNQTKKELSEIDKELSKMENVRKIVSKGITKKIKEQQIKEQKIKEEGVDAIIIARTRLMLERKIEALDNEGKQKLIEKIKEVVERK